MARRVFWDHESAQKRRLEIGLALATSQSLAARRAARRWHYAKPTAARHCPARPAARTGSAPHLRHFPTRVQRPRPQGEACRCSPSGLPIAERDIVHRVSHIFGMNVGNSAAEVNNARTSWPPRRSRVFGSKSRGSSAVEPILTPSLLEGAPHRIVAKIGNPKLSLTARWGVSRPPTPAPRANFAAELRDRRRAPRGRPCAAGGQWRQ